MVSWFIQHWPKPTDWDREENARLQNQLCEKGEIAVHYQDIESTDPKFYNKHSQKYIRKFVELANEGGYVCANYPPIKAMIIGKMKPKSKISIDQGLPILKRIKLSQWSPVSKEMRALLLVGAPTRATISKWKIIGKSLEQLVNKKRCMDWGSLNPSKQEIVCQEYLRAKYGLRYLLARVGGSMEDLDIIGISRNGSPIAAQVTFTPSKSKLDKKAKVLNAYKGELFFFSPDTECISLIKKKYPRLHFISTKSVWQWLESKPVFAKAILMTE
ncbi:hypothetical protein FJZ27_02860 [Candidatus Peribacteria bacterium]|nr:hypothetical protein [Candidatus Peribacteria bacterium]